MKITTGKLHLQSAEVVARDTVKLRFSADPKPEFVAGQFVSIQFSEKTWRAYSIASAPSDDFLEFVVRLIPGGTASEVLRSAKPGDEFNFRGAFGCFTRSKNPTATLVFCGTGTGIAPFRSMILEEEMEMRRKMQLLYGGRNECDLAYLDEIAEWSKNLKTTLCLSRETDKNALASASSRGLNIEAENCRVTKILERSDFGENPEFYLCGSGEMVKSSVEVLTNRGFKKEQIFFERFN